MTNPLLRNAKFTHSKWNNKPFSKIKYGNNLDLEKFQSIENQLFVKQETNGFVATYLSKVNNKVY